MQHKYLQSAQGAKKKANQQIAGSRLFVANWYQFIRKII
jgi:hypothetical protein